MKYTLSFNDEKFEVTEQDKEKIEQAVDEDIKFVQLSNGRTIDPLMVKEFKPFNENINWFSIDQFDTGESHKKMMISMLTERKKMMLAQTKPWLDLMVELKAKDKRKTVFREYSPYTKDGQLVFGLLEYNNKTNKVRLISESSRIPDGWSEKMRYLTVA